MPFQLRKNSSKFEKIEIKMRFATRNSSSEHFSVVLQGWKDRFLHLLHKEFFFISKFVYGEKIFEIQPVNDQALNLGLEIFIMFFNR